MPTESRDTVAPLIQELMYDERPSVRQSAARVLGEIDDKRAVEPLIIAALKDSDEDVCREAADALEKIGAESPGVRQALSKYHRREVHREKEEKRSNLTLKEALVLVERTIREAGGDAPGISLIMLPVTEILQKSGIGRKVKVSSGDEVSVAGYSMLIMSLVSKKLSGLIVTDSPATTNDFFEKGIAGSRLTANELAVKCGKQLFKPDSALGDDPGIYGRYGEMAQQRSKRFQELTGVLYHPDIIVVMNYSVFQKARNSFSESNACAGLAQVNSIIKVSVGLLEIYDGAGVSHLL